MIGDTKLNEFNNFIDGLSREELLWLNGYMSGIVRNLEQPANKSVKTGQKLTITFGTETGNSKKLATEFATKARKQGLSVKLASLDQYRFSDLSKEENFITIISTHGDGEPPAAAKKFFNHIQESALELPKLKFGVLALGDSAYPLFCKAGEDADLQLESRGAKRIGALQKCDVDFEEEANSWFSAIIAQIGTLEKDFQPRVAAPKRTGRRIYSGKVLSKVNLNGAGSAKETYHIELIADDLEYQPGDSIGIIPKNPGHEVEAIVNSLGIDRNEIIHYKDEDFSLSNLLTHKVAIFYLSERVVSKYATIVQQHIPSVRMDLINLLKIYPPQTPDQIIGIIQALDPITPRLYSISSAFSTHEGEVHITVARDRFELDGLIRHGLSSDYLAGLSENSTVEFYIHPNLQFKLPPHDKDIIMIGPGTGVAPFRSFIEERTNQGAEGKSWLFFGGQYFASDFLYQTEWQDYLRTGALTKMNAAFSRDQQEKIYVQHKIQQHAAEFFHWLNSGAFVYVCGAKAMSEDVEKSIVEIIKTEGGKTHEETLDYLSQLKEEGRYLKDVY